MIQFNASSLEPGDRVGRGDAGASAPAAAPAPIAVSVPALAPPDPNFITFLIQHPEARPRAVALLVTTRFELFAIGAPRTHFEAQPGTQVTLLNVASDSVDVAFGGATKRLPIAATDLARLAPQVITIYAARLKAENKQLGPAWSGDDQAPSLGQQHASLSSRSE